MYIAIRIFVVDCEEVWIKKYARPLNVGYRCITNTENYTTIANIPSHICTHQCMTRSSCFLVNYNFANRICLLSEEACVFMIRDGAFRTSHYHKIKPSKQCVYWTLMETEDRTRSIWSKPCAESPNECQVGRVTWSSEMSSGKYQPHKPQTVVVMGRYSRVCPHAASPGCVAEVLQVLPGCYVTWLSFNATTDPVPSFAIQGGYLNGGIKQFVIRVFINGGAIYGVYKDGFAGYVPHKGIKTFYDMELLTLL